jgi:hypothetical protein
MCLVCVCDSVGLCIILCGAWVVRGGNFILFLWLSISMSWFVIVVQYGVWRMMDNMILVVFCSTPYVLVLF